MAVNVLECEAIRKRWAVVIGVADSTSASPWAARHHDVAVVQHRRLHAGDPVAPLAVGDQRLDVARRVEDGLPCRIAHRRHATRLTSAVTGQPLTRRSMPDTRSARDRLDGSDRPPRRDRRRQGAGHPARRRPVGRTNGHIAPDYADSMLGREKVANTYLGSGIAIPHGLLKDRELIRAHRARRAAGARRRRVEPRRDACGSSSPSPPPPTSTCRSSPTSPRCSPTRARSTELVTTDRPGGRRAPPHARAGDDARRARAARRSTSTATPPPTWCSRLAAGCTPARRPPSSTSPRASRPTSASAAATRWPTARASPPC